MMLVYGAHQIKSSDRKLVGGKACALARMIQEGLPIPKMICVSTNAYNLFMDETGLRAKVLMEYHRKAFEQMRWEEMWDCSLRVQNMFAKAPIPSCLATTLKKEIAESFGNKAVAVRSSAVGEDSETSSFAGLHESYLNLRDPEKVLEHIRLVWASTWSDAAILYRKEIGLDVDKSSMAVVIQELVHGQESGIIFGRSPVDHSKAVVEAVHGLNQGLVDGTIEPDRWVLDRKSGRIVSHTPVRRSKIVVPASSGVKIVALSAERRKKPPLTARRVTALFKIEKKLAGLFGADQDVEWTYDRSKLRVLQSRPITTGGGDEDLDDRQWYMSLRRGFESLIDLRTKIEKEIIPGMVAQGESLAKSDPSAMTNQELAIEISRRSEICEDWKKQYWDFCIPFAHGMRLFGTVYNKTVKPEDPYEFLDVLAGSNLQSVKRNKKLNRLAGMLNEDKSLLQAVRSGKLPEGSKFGNEIMSLAEELRIPSSATMDPVQLQAILLKLLVEISERGPELNRKKSRTRSSLKKKFLESMPKEERSFGRELIDLARASYRLRDDDNIYLGRIEKQLLNALQEAHKRSQVLSEIRLDTERLDEAVKCLRDPNYRPNIGKRKAFEGKESKVLSRQLIGQPAGAGLAVGRARVIRDPKDLFDFKRGEVLVCDAIDPNMTFVVPLASAIVERRGGMLIHGAIIAREYGLPCVTGIPDADRVIRTGNHVTVDGYLGIVTINRNLG